MAAATSPRGTRVGFYAAYRVLAALFVVGVVVQFFLAGVGAFGALHEKAGDAFGPHAANGSLLSVLSLLMLVVVAVARPGRGLARLSVWLVAAMVVQNLLASVGDNHRWVGALHPVNGLVVTALAVRIAVVCFGRVWQRPGAPTVGVPQPRSGPSPDDRISDAVHPDSGLEPATNVLPRS